MFSKPLSFGGTANTAAPGDKHAPYATCLLMKFSSAWGDLWCCAVFTVLYSGFVLASSLKIYAVQRGRRMAVKMT